MIAQFPDHCLLLLCNSVQSETVISGVNNNEAIHQHVVVNSEMIIEA